MMDDKGDSQRLIPSARYSAYWYKEFSQTNPMCVYDDKNCSFPNMMGPEAWHTRIFCAEELLSSGSWAQMFPTATDCLFWLRWRVGPQQYAGLRAPSKAKWDLELPQVFSEIDNLPAGTHVARLLPGLCSRISADFNVYADEVPRFNRRDRMYEVKVMSVHDYLSLIMHVEQARYIFADPTINVVDSRWCLSDSQWHALGLAYVQNQVEALDNDSANREHVIRILLRAQRNAIHLDDFYWDLPRVLQTDAVESLVIAAIEAGSLPGKHLGGELWQSYFNGESPWIIFCGPELDAFMANLIAEFLCEDSEPQE
jgi:hypothetical protein